jgi:hypothetical protein
MKKRRTLRIAGLWLWKVEVSYQGRGPGRDLANLWITTPRKSLTRASEKAEAFLRRSDYGDAEIIGIRNSGTLDA